MNCNYKVNIKDIQNKYKFNIFAMGGYNDSDLRKMIESVFYALPRTTKTGTSVTLNDTARSYMHNELNATDTSQTGTPTPDIPIPINVVSGDNEVVVCGKQLWQGNKDYTGSGTVAQITQTLALGTYTISYNQSVAGTVQLNFRKSGSLAFSETIYSVAGNVSKTFNVNSEIDEIWIYLSVSMSISNIMINEGSAVLPYEPYQSNSVLLTLGDKEVCKIGDYEDKIFKAIKGNEIYDSLASEEKATLDYGKWYLRKAVGKQNISSQWWNLYNAADGAPRRFGLSGTKWFANGLPLKCNCFIAGDYNSQVDLSIWTQTGYLAITDKNSKWESKSDLITWLNNNDTILYYPLATPTNELFNDTIQDQLEDIYNNMLSYEGQTNVSQVNEDLPFNINSTALKDLNNL